MQAIDLLIRSGFPSDAWSLYRSVVERYFLFVHLCGTNEFDVFDDWCFKKHYEMENRLKSSHDLKSKPELRGRKFSNQQKERYIRVSANPDVKSWSRPDAEQVAREMKLKFLYDIGYDHASAFVHPVSTDGFNDYLCMMNRQEEISDDGDRVLLGNAQLVATLHIQHFLNEPEYRWRAVVYDLLDLFLECAGGGNRDCQETLAKVEQMHVSKVGLLSKTREET